MLTDPLCIYHGNCADGFGAAWAVRHALGDGVEFHAGVYQNPPPDVAGRDVIMVDFSYKRDVLNAMLQSADVKQAHTILILDHHKSAAEDLAGITKPGDGHYGREGEGYEPDAWRVGWEQIGEWPVRAVFDMDRSGAGVAWDFFHPGQPRPPLIDVIEDRDLWRFRLPRTREIQAALFSYPYDFEVWDQLMDPNELDRLALEGEAIERKHHKDVAELVEVCKRKMVIAGYTVPVASLPYTLTSDAGHVMCQPVDEGLHGLWVPPFAACYWDTPDGRVFSLRSDDKWGAVDVSEVAKKYGGGGHKNAAGFRVPLDEIGQFDL